MDIAIYLIAASLAYAVGLIFIGVALHRSPDDVQMRLGHYGRRTRSLEDVELDQPVSERFVKPALRNIANFILRFTPQLNLEVVRRKLDMAGNPYGWTPIEFLGMRGLAGLILGGAVFLITFVRAGLPLLNVIFLSGATTVIGMLLPVFWLGSKTAARQKEIQRTLPDVIDLMTVSVEAGLGLEAAMSKVTSLMDNQLAWLFARMLNEIQVGVGRVDALRNMAERAGVADLTSFVTAVIQAEQLGVSIAKVLRIQSEEMRVKRRQRAEEEAQRAPIKMSVVLVLLLLPALMMTILGPTVPRICKQFFPNNIYCN